MTQSPETLALFSIVADAARESGVFGDVVLKDGAATSVECTAPSSPQWAAYRVQLSSGGEVWVSLVMMDRWLSHSIEADLLNTGDKMEDLIAEELSEAGYDERRPGDSHTPCEHFRSEDKLFTFRSKVPVKVGEPSAAKIIGQWLRAYEGTFGELGDMSAGGQ